MARIFGLMLTTMMIVLISVGCIDREEAIEAGTPPDGEVVIYSSVRPGDPFVTDSVEVNIDGQGGNTMIFSLNAFEYENREDFFGFTAIGIPLPGAKEIDSTDIHGFASYHDALEDKQYISLAPGGYGMVEVDYFNWEELKIEGIFSFTLVDTITGEIITVEDGHFNTAIDSLY